MSSSVWSRAALVGGVLVALAAPAALAQGLGGAAEQALIDMHEANELEMKLAELVLDRAESDPIRRFAERLYRDHRNADQQVSQLADELGIPLPSAAIQHERAAQRPAEPGSPADTRVEPLGPGGPIPPGAQDDLDGEPADLERERRPEAPAQPPRPEDEQAQESGPQQKLEQLKELRGAAFEQRFLAMVEKAHRQEIAKLERALERIQVEEVRDLIQKLTPILGQHLELARLLQGGPDALETAD